VIGTTDGITFTKDGGVARVTIVRPEVMNALDGAAWSRLNSIWDDIERDSSVRVVVLTGSGDRAFCAGADMSAAAVKVSGVQYWAQADPNGFAGLPLRTTLRVPVIGRVNGVAVGGGLILLLGCDIVIASDTARFGLPEPRVGRLPIEGGITQLVRRIPYVHAMGLLLTGRIAEADEMAAMGLVNEVVAAQDLDAAVDRWVADIVKCAPGSLRAIKQVTAETSHLSAAQAERWCGSELVAALQSPDADEGVAAFREKRQPRWSQ
jgi:crotonobetainyl-CoA hydratase